MPGNGARPVVLTAVQARRVPGLPHVAGAGRRGGRGQRRPAAHVGAARRGDPRPRRALADDRRGDRGNGRGRRRRRRGGRRAASPASRRPTAASPTTSWSRPTTARPGRRWCCPRPTTPPPRPVPGRRIAPGAGPIGSLRDFERAANVGTMAPVLLVTHERYLDHDTGPGHPERPARLGAVLRGLRAGRPRRGARAAGPPGRPAGRRWAGSTASTWSTRSNASAPRAAGQIDPDTCVVPASWEAAMLAAGAGLGAIEALDRGEADAAFCAVRPPGHHATPHRPMGFCLVNNIAVTAAALADRGERVLIVDWDAHHGNGTQDAFYDDPRVLFVSMHQYPFYPGTGALDRHGRRRRRGVHGERAVPGGYAGRHLPGRDRRGRGPPGRALRPHLGAGVGRLRRPPGRSPHPARACRPATSPTSPPGCVSLVPPGRRIAFLEGGYDLDALAHSAAACVGALAGEDAAARAADLGRGWSRR